MSDQPRLQEQDGTPINEGTRAGQRALQNDVHTCKPSNDWIVKEIDEAMNLLSLFKPNIKGHDLYIDKAYMQLFQLRTKLND